MYRLLIHSNRVTGFATKDKHTIELGEQVTIGFRGYEKTFEAVANYEDDDEALTVTRMRPVSSWKRRRLRWNPKEGK